MHIPAYLATSRHRVFYFRWPLPKSKHPHQKASDIKLSLATRDFNEALQLSRLLAYLAQHLSTKMKNNNMRYDEMREVLKQHFTGLLEGIKERIAQEGRLKEDKIAFHNETIQHIEDDNYVEFWMGSYKTTLHSIIEEHDLPIKEGTQEYEDFRNEYKRSRVSFNHSNLKPINLYAQICIIIHSTATSISVPLGVWIFGIRSEATCKHCELQQVYRKKRWLCLWTWIKGILAA